MNRNKIKNFKYMIKKVERHFGNKIQYLEYDPFKKIFKFSKIEQYVPLPLWYIGEIPLETASRLYTQKIFKTKVPFLYHKKTDYVLLDKEGQVISSYSVNKKHREQFFNDIKQFKINNFNMFYFNHKEDELCK